MSSVPVFGPGNTALISGGASGIGLAVAHLCRKHGMKVAVVDINDDHLKRATQTLGEQDVRTYKIDVSKVEQWQQLRDRVQNDFGKVEILMLNAGIGLNGGWEDNDYFREVMDVNLFGVVNGLNTFVPTMRARNDEKPSAIVITGSKQGITNPPGNPAYNASKAAVKILAEHLSYDLRDTNTTVHLLVPGWTFTGLSGGYPGSAKEKPRGAWSPSQVAEYMFKKIQDGKFYIICPDNDVTEQMDKKRIMWSVGDIVNDRLPVSRWRPEYKEQVDEWMALPDI